MTLKNRLKKKTLLVPGVYDCLSALLAQKVGFKAIYLSGGALSVSRLGKPDIGLLTLDDVVQTARAIKSAVSLPLLVDVDTGFGGEYNIRRCISELEAAQASGIQIEDQVFPKRCGHLEGKSVVSPQEMVLKIKAACKARRSRDFLIIARTDARGVEGFKKALHRAELYRKAGADIIFPEALQSVSEFEAFSSKKGLGTLMANMTEFGISPAMSVDQLSRLGYRVILFPMTAFRRAARAMEETYKKLLERGESHSFIGQLQKRSELYDLLGYKDEVKRGKG